MDTARIAVFPGSFDPFTIGHFDIVERSLPLFDKIIVAIGVNALKKTMFTEEERIRMIAEVFVSHPQVEVFSYQGLTVNFCESQGARFMLRGVRNTIDFEYEKSIAQMNASINSEVETILLNTHPSYSAINSSIVRDILRNNGRIEKYLPEGTTLPERFTS